MNKCLRALALALVLCLAVPLAQGEGAELSISVSAASFLPGEELTISYTLPHDGMMSLRVYDAMGELYRELIPETATAADTGSVIWDGSDASGAQIPGDYVLSLSLDHNSSDIAVTFSEGDMAVTEDLSKTITPAYLSEYHPEHENCYWCTPMDITDEEAVWAMLTAPVTVLDIDQKQQAIVRAQPDKEAEGVAMLTGESQAVHVLENLDNGWSLVELYSSSFHDSTIKHWNAFTTGYIETDRLTTVTPNQTYGMVIDKLTQTLYLFKEGHLYSTLLVSTGLANERQPYNETRSGEFLIVSRVGDFNSDNMICAKALRFNDGDLLHEVPHILNADGTKNYGYTEYKLGTRASHGCIRVQRQKNEQGINHMWLWDNIKVGTKLVIWEDYAGRQMEMPDLTQPVYYNPDGGSYFHSDQNCDSVRSQYLPLTEITLGDLLEAPYDELTPCPYCAPPRDPKEILEINALHETTSPGVIPYE